jgi:hypothetical protein
MTPQMREYAAHIASLAPPLTEQQRSSIRAALSGATRATDHGADARTEAREAA